MTPRDDEPLCGAILNCALPSGHDGLHERADGIRWSWHENIDHLPTPASERRSDMTDRDTPVMHGQCASAPWTCPDPPAHYDRDTPVTALDRLPVLRLTGEQLDGLGYGLDDPTFAVDWDEYDEFVRLDDVRAALASSDDVARPGDAFIARLPEPLAEEMTATRDHLLASSDDVAGSGEPAEPEDSLGAEYGCHAHRGWHHHGGFRHTDERREWDHEDADHVHIRPDDVAGSGERVVALRDVLHERYGELLAVCDGFHSEHDDDWEGYWAKEATAIAEAVGWAAPTTEAPPKDAERKS